MFTFTRAALGTLELVARIQAPTRPHGQGWVPSTLLLRVSSTRAQSVIMQALLGDERWEGMSRTPLVDGIQRALAEVAGDADGWRTTRSGVLKKAGVAGLALTGFDRLTRDARAATPANVVVVGAGLAGLTAAHRLKQAGYIAQVHEASDRVGGRCWTGRGSFATGPAVRAWRGARSTRATRRFGNSHRSWA